MRHFICLLTSLLVFAAEAQTPVATTTGARSKFVEASLREVNSATSVPLKWELQQKAAKWERTKSDNSWFELKSAIRSADLATTPRERDVFVFDALSRLELTVPKSNQIDELKRLSGQWQQTKDQQAFVEFSDILSRVARANHIQCAVTISATGGPGAVVKYQTLGERLRNQPARRANSLTDLVERLETGMYHIWSERKGSPTSNMDDQFGISGPKEKVTLQENK